MGEVWRTLWPLVCLAVTAERVPVSSGLNWFSEVKPEREWDYLERDRGKMQASRHLRADRHDRVAATDRGLE